MDHTREERNFDLEADKRQRRNFLILVIAFAALAMIGGVALALWLIDDPDEDNPTPIEAKEKQPEPIRGFDPIEFDVPPERPVRGPRVASGLQGKDVDRGLGRIQKALDKCAAKHGAIDGTQVKVDFSVEGDGRVSEAYSRSPHSKTPLGLCVAKVIRTLGKFKRSKEGLRDIHRTIRLRRSEP